MRYLVSLIGHVFLNPVIFIYFSFVAPMLSDGVYIKTDSTNVYLLNFKLYFIFAACTALAIYLLLFLYNKFSRAPIHLKEIAQTKMFYLQLLGYGSTALTLMVYSDGMEGNIMGFIFFPMLIFGSFCLSVPYLKTFLFNFKLGKHPIDLDLKARFGLHLFNPFFINSMTPFREPELQVDSPILQIMAALITTALVYGLFCFVHFLVFKIAKKEFTVSSFFGENQYLSYWIPYIGGFYLLIRNTILLDIEAFQKLHQTYLGIFQIPFIVFIIVLLFVNYGKYLYHSFKEQ